MQIFFLNTFLLTRRLHWLQPRRRCFKESPRNLRSRYKNCKKKQIIQKKGLHKVPIVSLYAVFTTTPKFSSQSPRMVKSIYVFRRIKFLFFLKMFLWTRRMQWLQPRRRVFTESPKKLSSKYKIGKKKHIFQKNGLHKDPIASVNAVLTTTPKFSSQSPRMV